MAKLTFISNRSSGGLILLLFSTHSPFLVRFLERNGYPVSEAHSPDHLLALCVSNPVEAVIVDVCQLGEIEGWSVAQSVKMVRPSVSVVLLCHGEAPERVELPAAVDALASEADPEGLLRILNRHTRAKTAATS